LTSAAPATSRPPKVVLLGMMTKMPVAGVLWQNLHYLLGLERLGCEAYYVETHARTPSMLMTHPDDDSSALGAEFIAAVMRRFGLSERWAFRALHENGRCYGMSESKLEHLYGEAALLINLHGGTQPLPELTATDRLVYLETDPVQLQVELGQGLRQTFEFLEAHCAFFTFAENWGKPDCTLPEQQRFSFLPTRQPIVLDLWPDRSDEPAETFTTIGNWRQGWRDVTYQGERYTWSKHHEFLKYLELPDRTRRPFELALSSCEPSDSEMLRAHGWEVRGGLEVSGDLDSYRGYIGASRGEFTVAKDQNVRMRTGWFSDRSATYLASGRPVVTQDTGFGCSLPTGRGLFSFDSIERAADAISQIDSDHAGHCRAARALAHEHFHHEAVLRPMLEHLGVDVRTNARGRGRGPETVFAAGMVIEPVSRRPTTLPSATVEAAFRHPVSTYPEAPLLGRGSASIVVVTHDGLPFTRLCLESLLANTAGDFELIVVDNGSSDGTCDYLARLAQGDARVRVLLGGRNDGFAAACNRGLAIARGEHLVLLNNDTMLAPGWLAGLLAHLCNPEVGLVGPVTNRIGNEAEIETDYRTWGEFLALARERRRQRPGAWLQARTPAMFCLAMRRDTYLRLGPVDERYEVGLLEDDDYAERASEAGYQQRCVEDVLVHHFGEASFGRLFADGEYSRILLANQRRYAEKWDREWQPYGRRSSPRYERESERLRNAVSAAVPSGATVLVVSRGDEALLELDDHRALHFPQGEDGSWAGHHPGDSAEAIGQLEALRDGGAEYLVVPATYSWWLSHYEGLQRHLASRYETLVPDDGAGAIYRLQAVSS
jgi:GT2 family glycosyltransferase